MMMWATRVISSGKLQMNVVTGIGSAGVRSTPFGRGFHGSKYVMEFDCPVSTATDLGAILSYQNPENFMAVIFTPEEGTSYDPVLIFTVK